MAHIHTYVMFSYVLNAYNEYMMLIGQCSAVTVGEFVYVFIHGYYLVRYCPAKNLYVKLGDSFPLPQWVRCGGWNSLLFVYTYQYIYIYLFGHWICVCMHLWTNISTISFALTRSDLLYMYVCVYVCTVCMYVCMYLSHLLLQNLKCMYVCMYVLNII